MSLFVKAGLLWAKTKQEINLYLGNPASPGADDLFKLILDDLDDKQNKITALEARVATLEAEMPAALAS